MDLFAAGASGAGKDIRTYERTSASVKSDTGSGKANGPDSFVKYGMPSHVVQDITTRQALSEALRYWEPRRVVYNAALALVVTAVYCVNLPTSRNELTFTNLQGLFVLAVLANIAYCTAYIVDVTLQLSAYRPLWLRGRWTLLVVGIAFAAVLTNIFSNGFFAQVARAGS